MLVDIHQPASVAEAVALAVATDCARQSGEPEANLYVPAHLVPDSPQVAPWVDALQTAGWRLLVARHHYEFTPGPRLVRANTPSPLRLAQLAGPADPRLLPLHREVMRGTFDAYDRALIDRLGPAAAARRSLDLLLEADPWECLHLAFAGGPDPVGYVSWRVMPGGRGFVLFLGVAAAARGHGYGRGMLAHATGQLVAAGATTLIADTDTTNWPAVDAFARVGWPPTETRIDFVPAN